VAVYHISDTPKNEDTIYLLTAWLVEYKIKAQHLSSSDEDKETNRQRIFINDFSFGKM